MCLWFDALDSRITCSETLHPQDHIHKTFSTSELRLASYSSILFRVLSGAHTHTRTHAHARTHAHTHKHTGLGSDIMDGALAFDKGRISHVCSTVVIFLVFCLVWYS